MQIKNLIFICKSLKSLVSHLCDVRRNTSGLHCDIVDVQRIMRAMVCFSDKLAKNSLTDIKPINFIFYKENSGSYF